MTGIFFGKWGFVGNFFFSTKVPQNPFFWCLRPFLSHQCPSRSILFSVSDTTGREASPCRKDLAIFSFSGRPNPTNSQNGRKMPQNPKIWVDPKRSQMMFLGVFGPCMGLKRGLTRTLYFGQSLSRFAWASKAPEGPNPTNAQGTKMVENSPKIPKFGSTQNGLK